MAPNPVDTVNLNVYAFHAQYDTFDYNRVSKNGDLQNKQVGNDLQKMFPACSYQGRTIQLNWKVETPAQFDTPPDINKVNFYDLFLAIYDVGDCVGRVAMDFLARKCNPITATPYFKGKVIVVTPYNKKMLAIGRQDLPKDHVRSLTNKMMFETDFKNLDKIIPFAYRQDKLAEDALNKTDQWQFANGQEVDQAIQKIVQDKLAQMAVANKPAPVVNLVADEPIGVVNFVANEPAPVVNFVQDAPPVEEKLPAVQEKDIPAQPQAKASLLTRLAHLVGAILPSLVAAVTTLAMHILYPKLKEFQIVGIGAGAGTVMHLGINFFRRA